MRWPICRTGSNMRSVKPTDSVNLHNAPVRSDPIETGRRGGRRGAPRTGAGDLQAGRLADSAGCLRCHDGRGPGGDGPVRTRRGLRGHAIDSGAGNAGIAGIAVRVAEVGASERDSNLDVKKDCHPQSARPHAGTRRRGKWLSPGTGPGNFRSRWPQMTTSRACARNRTSEWANTPLNPPLLRGEQKGVGLPFGNLRATTRFRPSVIQMLI
jgi:hypothetical protein